MIGLATFFFLATRVPVLGLAGEKPYCVFFTSHRKLFKLRPRGLGVAVLIKRRKAKS